MKDTQKSSSYTSAFIAIVFTFFFWGFVAASNGILIPTLKKYFALSISQSQLVDTAFYIAYFVGSVIYVILSSTFGDPINKIGYKKGLIIGLFISAAGAFMFIPAVNTASYILFLSGLFTIGLGFALLQIVANPFVINLGDPSKGSHRLNLAGGINSLGTTIGPVILGYVLSKSVESSAQTTDVHALKTLYAALGVVLLILAAVIFVAKIPAIKTDISSTSDIGDLHAIKRKSVFDYPQLTLGMLAIFIYVGTEVTIQSIMGVWLEDNQIKEIGRSVITNHSETAKFISLYWGSLMIGRMSGAMGSFDLKKTKYIALSIIIPFLVFGIIILANSIKDMMPQIANGSFDFNSFYNIFTGYISEFRIYTIWIIFFILIKFLGQEKPSRTLVLFGLAAMAFMLLGLFSTGSIALFSFISGGLFCSVMWPCIFNLAIAGLGKHTNRGSSLLIMMILGGALIPILQGKLAESIGIHMSYWIPFVGFAYLAWYGFKARRILQKQGIDYDASIGAGH